MIMLNQSGAKWTTKRKARKFGQKRHLSVGDETSRDSWKMVIARPKSESKDYKAILAKKQKWFWVKPMLTLCLIFSIVGTLGYYFYQNYAGIIAREQQRNQNIEAQKPQDFTYAYNLNVRTGNSHLKSGNYDWAIYYYELALNSQNGDEQLFEDLVFASIMACETNPKYCEKIEKYENQLATFSNGEIINW